MIENIIFDLGGVILNIDFQRAADSFTQLGIKDFMGLYSKANQDHLFDRLEKGLIEPSTFRDELRNLSGLNLTDKQIDYAWNNLILDFPPARLQLLQELRKSYKIFLLSNTNRIHADFYNQNLRDKHGVDGLDALFDKVYYSHEIGSRKPDNLPYEHILDDQSIKAENCLFIDDSLPNILAADQLGFFTIFLNLDTGHDVLDLFEKGKIKY